MGIFGSVLSKTISIVVFLILLALLNIFALAVSNRTFSAIVSFLNNNALLIILIAVLFMVADVFWSLVFPLNLPFPLFNAIGSVFMAVFIISLIGLIDALTGIRIFGFISQFAPLIYLIVFVLSLVLGFVEIFSAKRRWHH